MFKELADIVIQKLNDYLIDSQNAEMKVLVQNTPDKIAKGLQLEELISNGCITVENIGQWMDVYLNNTQHMHHPNYMGHQVSVPHPASALADLIHGVVNNPMAIYEMGPAAATIEKVIINPTKRRITMIPANPVADTDHSSRWAKASDSRKAVITRSVSEGSSNILAKSRACSWEINGAKIG